MDRLARIEYGKNLPRWLQILPTVPYLEQPAGREIAHKFIRAAREAERRWVRPLGARGKQIEHLVADVAYLHAIDVWRNENHQQRMALYPGAIARTTFKNRTNIVGAAQEDRARTATHGARHSICDCRFPHFCMSTHLGAGKLACSNIEQPSGLHVRIVESPGEKVEELLRVAQSADVHRRLRIDEFAKDWRPITREDREGARKNRGDLRQSLIERKSCLKTKPTAIDAVQIVIG